MAYTYQTNLNSVINALKNYNTTTASPYLSLGLNTAVDNSNIKILDIETVQPRADRMPALYVQIESKDEEYSGIGATGPTGHKKKASVIYNIYGLVGRYGGYSEDDTLLQDLYTLAGNVEGIFQAEYNLSNTSMYCNAGSTVFKPATNFGDGFAKVFMVRLTADYLFR